MAVFLEPIPFRPDAGAKKMLDVMTSRWGLSRSATLRKVVRDRFEWEKSAKRVEQSK